MIEVNCQYCGKPKSINEWHYQNNKTKQFFCNNDCRKKYKSEKSKNNRIVVKCDICGTELSKTKSLYERNKTKRFYCKDCHGNAKLSVNCAYCGKQKFVKKYEFDKDKNHFCNKNHYDKFQRCGLENIKVDCSYCGKKEIKEVTPYEYNKYKTHFCNVECHDKFQIGKNTGKDSPVYNSIDKECAYCGKTITVQQNQLRERNYCNIKCRSQWVSKNLSGENSPIWLGGWSKNDYGPEFNKKNKEIIKERDNKHCCLCGTNHKNKKLVVHHIDYDKKNSLWCDEFNDADDWRLNNLITVCCSCHAKTNHNREFWGKYFNSTSGFWFATINNF